MVEERTVKMQNFKQPLNEIFLLFESLQLINLILMTTGHTL